MIDASVSPTQCLGIFFNTSFSTFSWARFMTNTWQLFLCVLNCALPCLFSHQSHPEMGHAGRTIITYRLFLLSSTLYQTVTFKRIMFTPYLLSNYSNSQIYLLSNSKSGWEVSKHFSNPSLSLATQFLFLHHLESYACCWGMIYSFELLAGQYALGMSFLLKACVSPSKNYSPCLPTKSFSSFIPSYESFI